MARDFDVDGKWLGDHVNSCQRERCKNPNGVLINCFSCHRAFCKPCWKKVSKMVRSVKAAKGFESCSTEPSQNPQPLLPGRGILSRRQPRDSSNKPAQLSSCFQDFPTAQNNCVVVSDSDDSGNESEKPKDTSIFSVSAKPACNIRPRSESQQNEQHLPPRKRHFEETSRNSTEGVEGQALKRLKLAASLPLIPISSHKPSSKPSSPGLHSDFSDYEKHAGDQGRRYISEGSYHTLEEWAMEDVSAEQQSKPTSVNSEQTHVRVGDEILGETNNSEGGRQKGRTQHTHNDVTSTQDTDATSMISKEDRQNTEHPLNALPDNGNTAIEEQYASASQEQRPEHFPLNMDPGSDTPSNSVPERLVTQPPTSSGCERPVQGSAVQSSTPAPGFVQTTGRTQRDPSILCVGMGTFQTGQEQNLDQPSQPSQPSQPQIYHRHHFPQSKLLESPETCPPVQQSSFQVDPPPGFSGSSTYVSQPSQDLEAYGSGDLHFPSRDSDHPTAEKVFPQPGCPILQPPRFRYAFTKQDIAGLPADQIKFGDGWFVQYNPQLPRVIDVSLLCTFHYESVVCCVRFSPNGKYVATGSNQIVHIFDVTSRQTVWKLQHRSTYNYSEDMYVRCLCFSPNGNYLATGSEDMHIRVWSMESGEIVHILTGHTNEIYSVDFASDNRTLASGSADSTARLWDVEMGSQMLCLTTNTLPIASVAFSPNIRYLAAGSYDHSVRVWNVATGLLVAHLQGPEAHTAPINAVSFSPSGEVLISGSYDHTVKMWEFDKSSDHNLESDGGRCVGTFEDHGDFVLSVAMTPDGSWILSGSKDQGVNFLDPHTRSCQLRIQGHQNSVLSVATNPVPNTDGGMFATGSGDKEAKIWVYTSFPAQQNSRLGSQGSSHFVSSGRPSSQTIQYLGRQPSSERQFSQSQFQKAPPLSQSLHGPENVSPNIPTQQQLIGTGPDSSIDGITINRADGQSHIIQKVPQPLSPSENTPGSATQAPQMNHNHNPKATVLPAGAVQAIALPTASCGSANVNKFQKPQSISCLHILDRTRSFALQAPQKFPQILKKLYSVRDSLAQDSAAAENHQEQRGKIEADIQKLEAIYQDLLQHVTEEDKDDNMLMKERTVASKRRQLEEYDRKEERYKVARENRTEIESFTHQVGGLKTLVPDVIKALQNLEVFLTQFDL